MPLLNRLIHTLISRAYADDLSVPIGTTVQENSFFGYTCIKQLIFTAADAALMIGAIASFAILVWGGVQWITGAGDKNQNEAAKTRITEAIIGLVIVACSWAIYQLVLYFLGINIDNICSDKPLG